MGILLAAVGAVSFTQAVKLDYDFHHFYRDAAYVWEHGRLNPDLENADRALRRQLPFYLPVVALILSPLTAGGATIAALLWTIAHLVALTYCLSVLARWSPADGSPAPPRAALVIATLAALPAIYETARFNQVSFFVLALVLAGVTALERGRPARAGMWLGLATAFKLLPAIFAVWLLLKRKWTALAALVVTGLVVAVVPCWIAFGPAETARYHREWWSYNVRGAAARGMVDPDLRSHFFDHRNQSIPAVAARLCWPGHPRAAPIQPLKLDAATCGQVSRGVALLLGIALVWLTRRPIRAAEGAAAGDAEIVDGMRMEAAVYLLAMLIFSPLLRTYYLVWAAPTVLLLTRTALDERVRPAQRAGQVGFALWLLGMLAWVSEAARACGVHLLMLIGLGGILLWLTARVPCYSRRKIRQAL